MAIVTSGPLAARSRWAPRWLQRQREDRELARWVAELDWQWQDAADIAHLARHSISPAKIPVTVVPQMHSVELGPPVSLLVRMLPGQVEDDYQSQAHRIAGGMDVPAVHIESPDAGWITVTLLDQ